MNKLLLADKINSTAVITLNRPEKHNAVNTALGEALANSIFEFDQDKDVRVIVLTGAGDKAFCAGADMAEIMARQRTGATTRGEAPAMVSTKVLSGTGKPVIAAINGYAYGLGAQLAVTADIRIASTLAKFRFVGTAYGLVVSGVDLPRVVGAALAKELLFTARVVPAEEAERIGLVNRVVPPDALMRVVLELAEQIAGNSPNAVRWAKRIVDAATTMPEAGAIETQAHLALAGTPDNSDRFSTFATRITGRKTP